MDYGRILGLFGWILGILRPLIIGGCIAFVLNMIMDGLNKYIFNHFKIKKEGVKTTLSLITAILLFILIIIALLWVIIPQLIESFELLTRSLPAAYESFRTYLDNLASQNPTIKGILGTVNRVPFKTVDLFSSAASYVQHTLTSTLNSTYQFATDAINLVMTTFVGVIFSFFLVTYKENLAVQCRKLLYSYLPKKVANETLYIFHLAYRYFNAFIFGQVIGGVVLFAMFFVVGLILRFPYNFMISVMIGITSLIPMFGSYIAYVIGLFLIVTINVRAAIYFTIAFFIIFNVEGNFIYPKIVGSTIGLPGIWVLAAVTIGANMLGVTGMLISVPIASILYTLVRINADKRLKDKKQDLSLIENGPDWDKYDPSTYQFTKTDVISEKESPKVEIAELDTKDNKDLEKEEKNGRS